ncbi:MAG: PVC-type heme-binding CxxCH protein [Cyclobacteriaceae bacterium]
MYRFSPRHFLFVTIFVILSCDNKPTIPPDFEIESGFNLELVANEPLVKDPVDLEFNENGDALVLEMPGYPFGEQQSRIIVLKDGDGDGVYDESLVFAENLQLATSILPYKSGVLVAAPPYLLYVKDENGDYKVDAVDTLMGGFSRGNLQHNYNGLTHGIDSWIYAANGGNSGRPFWWGDSVATAIDMRGQDLRFRPEEKIMERIGRSSGGFGLGVDEFARIYETHNLRHISHLVFPGRYIEGVRMLNANTLVNVSDHEENGLGRIYPIGEQESRVNHPEQSGYFSGGCGITYYGGGAFGPEYEQTMWVTDVVLNLVHVDKIKPKGAAFTASRTLQQKDLLASSDRAFRPVNMSVGPDGSMYVVDMYRKVIEHPEWIPDELEKDMDLDAGKDKGRIYRISKANTRSTEFDFNLFKNTEGLINSLSHPNQWVRSTAHRLLADQTLSDRQVADLGALLSSESPMARLHAMWVLESSGKLTEAQLLRALDDQAPGVRENALLVAENKLQTSEEVLHRIMGSCNDSDQRVRMQAALSASLLSPDAFDKNKDDILSTLMTAAGKPSDDWNFAAITLASKHGSSDLFASIATLGNKNNEPLLQSLAMVSSSTFPGLKKVLETIAKSNMTAETKEKLIGQLAQNNLPQGNSSLLQPIRTLEQSDDMRLVSASASLRHTLKLPPSPEFLRASKSSVKAVIDKSLPDSVRLQHLEMISLLPYNQKSDVLFACLENTEPLKIQEAALQQLSAYTDPAIGKKLVEKWPDLGPQVRRFASDVLLYKKVNHDALLSGLEKGIINIGEMNFDLERRRTLLRWTDDENTKRRAQALFSDAGVVNRKDAIDKMRSALSLTGSSENGKKVFTNVCGHCHIYGSEGQSVGPVLTEINRKSKESLLHDILDPNAAVDTKYINHRVETKDGDLHMGIVDSETDESITIKKMGGEIVTINKTDIKKFNSLGTSMMMEGLEGSMSQQEMADLLAYLQQGVSTIRAVTAR